MNLKKMKINLIWEELANDSSIKKGLLLRRYSGTVLPNVFIALKQPEKVLCIAASLSENTNINISPFDRLQEIGLELFPDYVQKGKTILLIKLINIQHKDIFSVLCEDLIESIKSESKEKELVRALLNRFEIWKSLFSRLNSQGLSLEEQRGLFGELYFLRKFIQYHTDFQHVLNSWVGPSGEVRDFQMKNWALEVKTTHGNNHQKVQISNERQLDNTHLEKLFLFHLSLEKVQENGESLNQIIKSINNILALDGIALMRFRAKLYEAGYFEHQADLYNETGYFIRQDAFYLIRDNFPRIQEKEISRGVGDVKYSIILSYCKDYKVSEYSVFENLTIS